MKMKPLPNWVPTGVLAPLILFLFFTAAVASGSSGKHDHSSDAARGVTLIDGLIDLQFPITTDSQATRDYFNPSIPRVGPNQHTGIADKFTQKTANKQLRSRFSRAKWGR